MNLTFCLEGRDNRGYFGVIIDSTRLDYRACQFSVLFCWDFCVFIICFGFWMDAAMTGKGQICFRDNGQRAHKQ